MEKFKESVITDAGRKMLLGLGAGNAQLTYTKAVLYDQDLSSMELDQMRALTTMSGEKLSTEIKRVKVKDNTVIAYAVFQNADLADDVVFRAVGWYAKSSVDNIERLLAISPSIGTQTLASGSPDHRSTAEIDINLAMAISKNVNVTVEVDPTGMVNNQDLTNAVNDLKIEINTKIEDIDHYTKAETDARINEGRVKTVDGVAPDASGDVKTGRYTNTQIDQKISEGGKVRTVNRVQPDGSGDVTIDTGVTSFNGQKGDINFSVIHKDYASPQDAYNASAKQDGIHIYDPDDGPQSAVIGDETITVSSNHDAIINLQAQNGDLSRRIDAVDSKATDATNLAKSNLEEINALKETKPDMSGYVTQEEFQNATLGFKISQADYNKLPSEQKQKDRVVYLING